MNINFIESYHGFQQDGAPEEVPVYTYRVYIRGAAAPG